MKDNDDIDNDTDNKEMRIIISYERMQHLTFSAKREKGGNKEEGDA